VVAIEEVEPKIFKYLEEYFNTGFINSLDDQAADAVMVLGRLWVLAEFAGADHLQNAVITMLHPALYQSRFIQDFFHYAYSIPDRLPWTSPRDRALKKQIQFVHSNNPPATTTTSNSKSSGGVWKPANAAQEADMMSRHSLKLLAMRYAAWIFSKETLAVVSRIFSFPLVQGLLPVRSV
jgi:hypothetical protein